MSKESFKSKLKEGAPVLVVNVDHACASLCDSIAGMDVDSLLIDCEHGSADVERVQDMCRAAKAQNVHSIVRPETDTKYLLTRYLDAGARGLMVPHVDTAAQALEIVRNIKSVWYKDFSDTVVTLMLESETALNNLDDILKIENVDAFMIGPDDLSQSMGLPGGMEHPKVQAAILDAVKRIRAQGKVVGTGVNNGNIAKFYEMGCRYLYVHADSFLQNGIRDFRSKIQ